MEISNFNLIAQDYHLKRKKPWRPVELFLKFLKDKGYAFNGLILDLGCGNGRNFQILSTPPNKLIGIDISLELLKMANHTLNINEQISLKNKNFFQLILGDISNPPIRQKSIDCAFCIASLHHIKKKSERTKTITQIRRSLKKTGLLILTVWRKWQNRFRNYFILEWVKRKLSVKYRIHQQVKGLEEFGDKLVPWKLSRENSVFFRFYHFFSKHELKKLLKDFEILEFKITGGPTNKDNFFVLALKI
ncbi:MAG: class I SAM-dependent methyltransferase [Candidatus Thorarchaeota archaeon]